MFLNEKKIPVLIGDIGGTNSRLSIVKMSKVNHLIILTAIRTRRRCCKNSNFEL